MCIYNIYNVYIYILYIGFYKNIICIYNYKRLNFLFANARDCNGYNFCPDLLYIINELP